MLSESNRQPIIALLSINDRDRCKRKEKHFKSDIKSWRNLSIAVHTHMGRMASNFNKLSLSSFDKPYELIATPFIHFFLNSRSHSSNAWSIWFYIVKRRRNEQKAYYYGNLGQQCVHIESLPWLTCFHFQCYVFLMAFSDNDGGGFDDDDLFH